MLEPVSDTDEIDGILTPTPVTVARGDGIGPEIMDATLRVLAESGARLALEQIDIGERVYQRGQLAGIEPQAWESLRRTRVFLKAPITTSSSGKMRRTPMAASSIARRTKWCNA